MKPSPNVLVAIKSFPFTGECVDERVEDERGGREIGVGGYFLLFADYFNMLFILLASGSSG